MLNEVVAKVIGVGILLVPVILIVVDLILLIKKKEVFFFEMIAFLIGSGYIYLAYEGWNLPEYDVALNLYDATNIHEPFSTRYVGAIILFALWGLCSYFILKYTRKKIPPLLEVLLLAGVYVGCGICLICMIQLLGGADPEGKSLGVFDYIVILCLCVVPFIYLVHSVLLIFNLVRERAEKQSSIHYSNPVMQRVNLWLLKGANLFWVAVIMILPVLGILVMLLCLFGQQPDSILLAFTKTSDWILSGEIAPPPVEYDSHYLCTVSLRGHKKVVKPIRYGIRRGERIVVNRQLCVANAFEELIMEKTPRFHRTIRHFYDTYGYPISKHIRSAWSADAVYLMMKPLEWIFLTVLYLFDGEPENRICRQYLPIFKAGKKKDVTYEG